MMLPLIVGPLQPLVMAFGPHVHTYMMMIYADTEMDRIEPQVMAQFIFALKYAAIHFGVWRMPGQDRKYSLLCFLKNHETS